MSSQMSITFTSQANVLEAVVEVLSNHKTDDYYAYERGEYWYIGIGSRSSLVIDSQGQTVTVNSESGQASRSINGTSIADTAREITTDHLKSGFRIFGQVGFNYAAHILGQEYTPGNWPLLALLVPRLEARRRAPSRPERDCGACGISKRGHYRASTTLPTGYSQD